MPVYQVKFSQVVRLTVEADSHEELATHLAGLKEDEILEILGDAGSEWDHLLIPATLKDGERPDCGFLRTDTFNEVVDWDDYRVLRAEYQERLHQAAQRDAEANGYPKPLPLVGDNQLKLFKDE